MSCCCCLPLSTSAAGPKRSTVAPTHLFCLGVLTYLLALLHPAAAFVNLRGNSFSFSFLDAPARFAVSVDGSGVCGSLHLADPIDACSSLQLRNGSSSNLAEATNSETAPVRFVLIVRGVCSFETKVRNAQDAGYQAAIVYDDREKSSLISMIGNSDGIKIHAVFVNKMAGETLKKFSQGEEGECCIGPSADETAGNVLVISLCSLVIILSVLATFFFARNCQRLRRATQSRPQSISKQEVEVLPCITFSAGNQMDRHVSDTCAICLEDYIDGEILRVLPCQHEFHSPCIDPWLMKWGTSCPVCKHDLSSRHK